MNNQQIVRLRSLRIRLRLLRVTASKHSGSHHAILHCLATAPCVVSDRRSGHDSTFSIREVVPPASMQSKTTYQSGAVLIISLIMLLLLTLIGTTSMQSTSLEEKMVGNMRDQNIAFQAAEAALRVGEAATATSPAFTCAGTGGYYDVTTLTACLQPPYWQTIDWNDTNKTVTYNVGGIRYSYYIEQLDSIVNDNDILEAGVSLDSGLGSPPTLWYRVTARGTGNTNNAVVLLQSTYTR